MNPSDAILQEIAELVAEKTELRTQAQMLAVRVRDTMAERDELKARVTSLEVERDELAARLAATEAERDVLREDDVTVNGD